jgi:hypothetical protein
MNELSLRETAARYLGVSGGFSVIEDVFSVPQITSRNEWAQKYVVRDGLITEMEEYNIQVDTTS